MADLASIAAALGDPLRIRILDFLARGRRGACCSPENPEAPVAVCACDISECLGHLAASKLAYHLRRLREVGLVREQRRGKWVYYSINDDALAEICRAVAFRWSKGSTALPEPDGAASHAKRSKRRPRGA
jgi:ArsR family transcriptional regulator